MTGKTCAAFWAETWRLKPDLDFALLPLSEAVGPDEHEKGAAGPKMLFQPGLPGLPGRKGIAVEEGGEPASLRRARKFPPRPSPPANSSERRRSRPFRRSRRNHT